MPFLVLLLVVSFSSLAQCTNQTRSYTIKDGGMIKLNCTNNETDGLINWMVNDVNLHELVPGSINFSLPDNDTLIIRNPRDSQVQGRFNVTCMANNTVNTTFHLFLLKAPKILTKNLKLTFITDEHSNISIPCETTGYPRPDVEWWFHDYVRNASQGICNDKLVVDGDTKKSGIVSYEVFVNGTLQIINPLSKIHVPYDNFTCVARNIAGKDSQSHRLFIGTVVSYTFEVTLNEENITKELLGKVKDALWTLKPYDMNITHVNSTLKTVGFEITWKEENQTQGVQAIAGDVRRVLDGAVVVSKFVMNGAPGPPTDLEVTSTTTSEITFHWKHPKYFIIDKYQILSKSGGKVWRNHEILDGTKTSLTVDGLDADTKYLFKIHGVRQNQNGVESKILHAETEASVPVEIIVPVVLIIVIAATGVVLGVVYYRRTTRERTILALMDANPYALSLPGVLSTNIYTRDERTYCPTGTSSGSEDIEYFSWREISRESLTMGDVLGSGEFGLVVKALLYDEETNRTTPVAVKTVKGNATEADQKELFKELRIIADIGGHPHIVNLVGACSTGGNLCLVVEFCEHGELLKYLRNPKNRAEVSTSNFSSTIRVADRLKIAFDVSKGMKYLEGKKVVHRDLAARNVLLGENYIAKVSDFGLSRDIYEAGLYVKKGAGKLPAKWMAIESLQQSVYTSKSDVWSFGVLMWEIESAGMVPYPGMSGEDLMNFLKNGFRLTKPPETLPEIYDMMMSCWQARPDDRPSFSELEIEVEQLLEQMTDYLPVLGEESTNNDEESAYINKSDEDNLSKVGENSKTNNDEDSAYVNEGVEVYNEDRATTSC